MRSTIDMQINMKYRNRRNNFYSILACIKQFKGVWSRRVRTYINIFLFAAEAVITKEIKAE